jgi:hypothetical protein
MPGPRGALGIRVNDGLTDRLVTQHVSGLRFTKVAPGGHQSLSFQMALPGDTFNNLGPQDRAYVYDTRTARPVVEGYMENPTPTDGPNGQRYTVSAAGGMALANDETRGIIYVDKTLDGWDTEAGSSPSANMRTGIVDTVPNTGVEVQFSNGQVAATNAIIAAGYRRLAAAGMSLGAVRSVSYSGKTDTGYRLEMYTDDGTVTPLGHPSQIQTGALDQTFVVGTHFGAASRMVLQLRRSGAATNVADDLTFGRFVGLVIMGQRVNRYGALLTGTSTYGTSALTVLGSQVAEDLLGRILTMCDPTAAQIDVSSFGIDQLAYPDGVKAADVLSGLAEFEPDFLWEILESLPNGKHRFNYREWPTKPRYVVSVRDGWQEKGSDIDLCNRILVRWTDATGQPQTTPVTAADLGLLGQGLAVDELDEQGRTKDADPITLPEGKGSLANALRIGGQVLADKINPSKAGTVVVRRPILDLLTGNWVEPWELEPGYVCQVRETGDNLRVTQVDYDDDPVASTLTLGRPVLTEQQRLAKLARTAA